MCIGARSIPHQIVSPDVVELFPVIAPTIRHIALWVHGAFHPGDLPQPQVCLDAGDGASFPAVYFPGARPHVRHEGQQRGDEAFTHPRANDAQQVIPQH